MIRSLISANVRVMKRIAVGKRDNVKEIRADGKEAFYIGRWEKGREGAGRRCWESGEEEGVRRG